MSKILVKELLTSSNYWTLNKTIVKIFGIETAFLLTNLAEAETMMSDKDGWFYQTSETLEEFTSLSRYKQDKAIDELVEAGVLQKDVRGIPAKRYFKLDYEALANKIASNSQTRVRKTNKQEPKKLATNKELSNKELSNKEHNNSSREFAKTAKYADDSRYMSLAKRLHDHIKKRNPKQKEPNWQTWADDFRKTIELDKRDFKEAVLVLDWCQRNEFWQNNILSPVKFRKQYDQLFLKMDSDQQKTQGKDWENWDFFG